jgi:hypothetical protein
VKARLCWWSIGTGQHSQIGHNCRMSNLLAAVRRLARDRVHARAVRLPIAALAVPFFLSAQPTGNVRKAKLAQKESGVKPPQSKGYNHELHE